MKNTRKFWRNGRLCVWNWQIGRNHYLVLWFLEHFRILSLLLIFVSSITFMHNFFFPCLSELLKLPNQIIFLFWGYKLLATDWIHWENAEFCYFYHNIFQECIAQVKIIYVASYKLLLNHFAMGHKDTDNKQNGRIHEKVSWYFSICHLSWEILLSYFIWYFF